MDTSTLKPEIVPAIGNSRLPAGSTLQVAPGVFVPHPHAEPNLPGAGDPRLGDTKSVNEVVVDGNLVQSPLPDEVKPKVVKPKVVTLAAPHAGEATLETEKPTLAKTE